MSYRHRSYRKLSRAVAKASAQTAEGGQPDLTRSEMDRVLHWSSQAPMPKPFGWGKPEGWRA